MLGQEKSAYTLNSSGPPRTFLRVNSLQLWPAPSAWIYPCARPQILISLSFYSTASIFTTPPHTHHAKCKCLFLVFNERTVHFWRSVAAFPRCASPTEVHVDFMHMVSFMIIHFFLKRKRSCYQLIIVCAGEESEPCSRMKTKAQSGEHRFNT